MMPMKDNGMKRITPEIIIPPKEIETCSDCPFYVELKNDYAELECECSHPKMGRWGTIIYATIGKKNGRFHPDEAIYPDCPLPLLEENK